MQSLHLKTIHSNTPFVYRSLRNDQSCAMQCRFWTGWSRRDTSTKWIACTDLLVRSTSWANTKKQGYVSECVLFVIIYLHRSQFEHLSRHFIVDEILYFLSVTKLLERFSHRNILYVILCFLFYFILCCSILESCRKHLEVSSGESPCPRNSSF